MTKRVHAVIDGQYSGITTNYPHIDASSIWHMYIYNNLDRIEYYDQLVLIHSFM